MLTQQQIAFQNLLEKHQDVIYKIIWMFSKDDAFYFDELKQEIGIALWQEFSTHGLNRFRQECSESTWIYQIAYNTARHYYLKNSPHSNHVAYSQELTETLANTDNPQDRCDFNLLMDAITDEERRWLDYHLKGLNYKKIAQAEHISVGAARVKMFRILNKIRKMNNNG